MTHLSLTGFKLSWHKGTAGAPKALCFVRACVWYARPSSYICVPDIFLPILSCVYVFYVSLWGPSKGTLRCYTSICDGIISTVHFLNICITLNLHGRHLLIGLSPNSPQLSTTVHHLPIGCSDDKRKFQLLVFHIVFWHVLQTHTDMYCLYYKHIMITQFTTCQ